jgi:RNA polymerase sigma-70 factor (ECF subfamily)
MVSVTPAELPSLRQLFDEHARYIWRSLRHLGVGDADIEDVCQEVFLVAHRKLPEFAGRSALRTWLYGICLRQASDYRRRAYVRRERPTAELPVDSMRPATSSDDPENAESRALLLGLLAQLDDEKREVVVLYELEGFSMREVAEIVGCPLQTAYSRLYAARERLSALAQATESVKP